MTHHSSFRTHHSRKAYPAYKPSGVPWLGDVPEHWDVRRLKYTATINDEALPETTDPDYDFTYVDIGSVDASKGIVATETYRFEDAPSRARRIVRDGDTIVSTVRTYLRAIAAIREPAENLIVSTGFAVVRPRSLDPGYLSYALRSPFFVETVVSRSTGVSYPAINAPEVGNIGVTLPPFEEQKAIAAFLDRETARIDALIEKKRRQIELLQEKRLALISHAVTSGLDPNAPMKDSGIEWLGQIPDRWDTKRLKFLCMFITSGSRGWAQYYSDTGPVFIRIGNLTRHGIDLRTDDLQRVDPPSGAEGDRTRTRAGDLLISVTAYIGSVAVVPNDLEEAYVNQHTALARLRSNTADSRWVAYCLASASGQQQFRALVYGGTKEGLSLEDVGDLRVILPPIAEQRAIANYIDGEYGRTQRLIAKIAKSIENLNEFRTALIAAAVTGKIDVRGEVS